MPGGVTTVHRAGAKIATGTLPTRTALLLPYTMVSSMLSVYVPLLVAVCPTTMQPQKFVGS